MEERAKRAKSEQVKLDEINFLRKIERDNKVNSINRKLELTSKRRNKILSERVEKCSVKAKNKQNEKINMIEQVFNEDFIWKLFETEYFDIEDAIELSNMNKFEIMKRKMLKQAKYIDELMKKKINKVYINPSTIYHQDIALIRRSKSFTNISEKDLIDINHFFPINKKNQKKKKREKLKSSLIKSINSMSAGALSNVFSNLKSDKKTRKYILKNRPVNLYGSAHTILDINEDNISVNSTNTKDDKKIFIEDPPIVNLNNNYSSNSIISSNEKDKEKEENKFSIENSVFNENDLTGLNDKFHKVKFCKLCNSVLTNEIEVNNHINSREHKKLKVEYNINNQDDQSFIIIFTSEVSEELKSERLNSIKLKFKKIKQKISLKALKHDAWANKSDIIPSTNKQRILKICFDVEKLIGQNSRDFEVIDNNLKELIKILEQKKQSDLHLIRTQKMILLIFELMKKPPFCHKSEIKALGKVLETGIKILMIFLSLRENKNYLIMTNRITICVDLLLWVLNKPSKIPLGIGFLPDLVYLITISLKHKIPYEYQSMKDDLVEYILYSGLLLKLKQKYDTIQGPVDLTTNLGTYPVFIQKSLQMIENLVIQLYINHYNKPVYFSLGKLSDDVVFLFESTELLGQIQLLYTLLLNEGPYKVKFEKEGQINNVPITVISTAATSVKILCSLARANLMTFQTIILANNYLQETIHHIFNFIISYALDHFENSDDTKELLHETILLIGYFSLLDHKLQMILLKGEVTVIQRLFSLPFNYFFDTKLKELFMPTAICVSYENERVMEIINKEVNINIFTKYLKEKINLEPIVEDLNESIEDKNIKNNEIISNASSTKSINNMVTAVSDFLPLVLRFPRKLWEKALEFYSKHI